MVTKNNSVFSKPSCITHFSHDIYNINSVEVKERKGNFILNFLKKVWLNSTYFCFSIKIRGTVLNINIKEFEKSQE